MKNKITINCHSSIKIVGEKTIYVDPYCIEEESHDADLIFVTHDHYDHYELDSIKKLLKEDTLLIVPSKMLLKVINDGVERRNLLCVNPSEQYNFKGTEVLTIPSYNVNKNFHKKDKQWVGYVIEQNGEKIYIAGDTDINEDNKKVKCDIALVPIDNKYTMSIREAAELVNTIKPKYAIPTHYGKITGKLEDGQKFAKLIDKDIICNIILK